MREGKRERCSSALTHLHMYSVTQNTHTFARIDVWIDSVGLSRTSTDKYFCPCTCKCTDIKYQYLPSSNRKERAQLQIHSEQSVTDLWYPEREGERRKGCMVQWGMSLYGGVSCVAVWWGAVQWGKVWCWVIRGYIEMDEEKWERWRRMKTWNFASKKMTLI